MAYFLWMTFGWLGVHHLYLRRHRHGFVWLWTFGGCCGLGWLLELWRLPYYVGIANDTVTTSHRHTASYSWKQITGELVFSMVLGVLSVSAIPKSIVAFSPLLPFLAIIFIAAGLYFSQPFTSIGYSLILISNDSRLAAVHLTLVSEWAESCC